MFAAATARSQAKWRWGGSTKAILRNKSSGSAKKTTKPTKRQHEAPKPTPKPFPGYFNAIRDIMRMPTTTADPNILSRRVTAEYCSNHYTQPPRNVSMLTRDFISDSLYNPSYGYFSKQALIFSPRETYNFGQMRDSAEFLSMVGRQYDEMERELDDVRGLARQLWHTPTELFKPWYGRAVARHIVNQHKADCIARGTDDPLVIYEMGGGNGTLMADIIGYVHENEPGLFSRMQYNIVEISAKLARNQLARQLGDSVRVINKSMLQWNELVDKPCFFVAMEVIDNFAHDVVRYDYETGVPLQTIVRVYDDGEMEELYEPITDTLVKDYLAARSAIGFQSPALPPSWKRKLRMQLPLAPNLTRREFIPTQTFQLCRVLRDYFPRHRLVLSDFYTLPDSVPDSIDAPVVQTRFSGNMVPCETYLVQPGWFDIFFPTNFELLQSIYNSICRSDGTLPESQVCTQREFVTKNAELDRTRTRSGENPLVDFYENNKFLLS
ncbi:hypothetical protein GGI07_000791 [Coemansia sp. Benny D115]|nr:hypothetical protein GGI07_000791 [Coemansia sp. Benny D115]